MRARLPIVEHETTVHYGDWHIFAVCRTCGWEGERSGLYYAGRTRHRDKAKAHASSMRRKQVGTNRWWRRLFAAPVVPVVHKIGKYVGRPTLCCGINPEDMRPWDNTTSDATKATCPESVTA